MKIIKSVKEELETYPILWPLLCNTVLWIFNTVLDACKIVNFVIGLEGNTKTISLIWIGLVFEALFIVLFIIQKRRFSKTLEKAKKEAIESIKPDKELLSMKSNKTYYDKLTEIVNRDELLLSVQLYECPDLIDPNDIRPSDDVFFCFKRIGGVSREKFITNCVLFERFVCSGEIYGELYDILKSMRRLCYKKDSRKHVRQTEITKLAVELMKFIKTLKKEFIGLSDISDVTEKQFFYYSTLQLLTKFAYILTEWGLGEDESTTLRMFVNNNGYLLLDENVPTFVEDYLKRAKRTGLLGAYFKKGLYLFGNENSSIKFKQERNYFATPISGYDNRFSVCTYDRSLLGISHEMTEYACCKELIKDIRLELEGVK